MNKFIISFILSISLLIFHSCGNDTNSINNYNIELYNPKYASGFSILGSEGKSSTIIKIKNPWQGATDIEKSLFISRNGEKAPNGFKGEVLNDDAQRVVCMSSTYVAMLDAISAVESVVGVSGLQFITNSYISNNKDEVGDVGYDGNINYELLISLKPDIVLLYGVGSASTMEPKLKELNIPFIYVGEYLESDPLGKSEWMVAVGEIVGKRVAAEKRFEEIPLLYNSIKEKINTQNIAKPKVMVNTPYEDNWFIPSSSSYVVRLIEDAGGEYVYPNNHSNRSITIGMEEALYWASMADLWINVDGVNSIKELKGRFPKFSSTPSVTHKRVFKNDLRSSPNGGNDYWESGVVYPNRVLSDMAKSFYPEIMEDTEFYYFRKLE